MEFNKVSTNKKRFNTKNLFAVFAVLIILTMGIYILKLQRDKNDIKNAQKIAEEVVKKETGDIISRVSKIMLLPNDEQPVLMTVLDKEKLKDQPFFKDSEKDDSILVYAKARKAIVYRKRINKIVNVGPIAIDQKAVDLPKSTVKIITTKTSTTDLNQVEKTITNGLSDVLTISTKENSANSTAFSETQVVDLTGNKTDIANQIAEKLGGKVTTFPEGESKPENTDIVVFVK